MEHSHVMGGSTAARRINCPGSLELEQASPEQETSEYAERGSMLHAAMEILLTADPQTPEAEDAFMDDLIGQDLGFGPEHVITKELIDEKIWPAWQAWLEVLETYDLDDWMIEQRVSLESVIPGAFGTADVIAKDTQKRLHILDWKFGDGVPVPVEGNMGLGFYAGAALYDDLDSDLVQMCDDISGIVLHIVQPRTGSDQVLNTWETTEDWVEKLIEQADRAMKLARGKNPPLTPGSWCQFCRARITCPAQNALASTALSNAPKYMTSVDLGAAMEMAMQLKSWIAEVVKLAEREAEAGAVIPGFKLVNKRPTRVWTDEKKAEKMLKAGKHKVGEIFTKKLISPTQAEKLNKELYNSKLSDIVVFHSSGLTLVPDSDKRQAVVSSAELLSNALPDRKQEN